MWDGDCIGPVLKVNSHPVAGETSKLPKREGEIILGLSKNKITKFLWTGVVFLFLVSPSPICWADAYEIPKDVLNGGIQEISSDAHSVWSSVGQSAIGNMQGGEYVLMGGFWSAFTYFVAGDPNNDQLVNSADVIYLINYLFVMGSPAPAIWQSGDVNCNGAINSADIVYLINYLFAGGPAPIICDP